eukprot:TRINITY_DN32936_c0_g1_i1.p1 TRINITY_DN32936_c0_g1~~TRINITY_DN32936_c0_g1_i1.p1  ORF type:complete len:347 (+),score=35.59 TRINITY_DN32936_c0_g1_i1:51-1043(+)
MAAGVHSAVRSSVTWRNTIRQCCLTRSFPRRIVGSNHAPIKTLCGSALRIRLPQNDWLIPVSTGVIAMHCVLPVPASIKIGRRVKTNRYFTTQSSNCSMTEDDKSGYPRDPADPSRRMAPSNARNKGPILEILTRYLKPSQSRLQVLEIASGTGEHVAHFAAALPHTMWQPTEWKGHASLHFEAQTIEDICASIRGWTKGLSNVHAPLALDAGARSWPPQLESGGPSFSAVVASNIAHIAPREVLKGLLAGAARILESGGYLFLYGPFAREGSELSQGNAEFDAQLRAVNHEWGVREVNSVRTMAEREGLTLVTVEDMPANNTMIVFAKL